jgi:hypothetical protein
MAQLRTALLQNLRIVEVQVEDGTFVDDEVGELFGLGRSASW